MKNQNFLSELVLHFKDIKNVKNLVENPLEELKKLGIEPGDYYIDYEKFRYVLVSIIGKSPYRINILEKIKQQFPTVRTENSIFIGISKKKALKWLKILND